MSSKIELKKKLLQKRRWRIRKKVHGDETRPRLSVRISNKHIHAQIIDDEARRTVVAASTLGKDIREQNLKANVEGASALGKIIADKAKGAGVETVVYDRNGRRYHGAVKAFADSAREAGLKF